jgi:hypothetical protein
MTMPSYDNDVMAVIKGTANDGVVVARADAILATVQCAVVRTSILRTMDEMPVEWSVHAGPTLQFSALMVVRTLYVYLLNHLVEIVLLTCFRGHGEAYGSIAPFCGISAASWNC